MAVSKPTDRYRALMKVVPPPEFEKLIKGIPPARLFEILRHPIPQPDKYLHWNELRYRKPPRDFTGEEWWLAIKILRGAMYREIPHHDKEGHSFVYSEPDPVRRSLHRLDINLGTGLQDVPQGQSSAGRHHVINTLIEEAITSSQLEGAVTTRKVAREILKQGKKPSDISQRMIVNNYLAIEYALKASKKDLTPETVLRIHEIMTEETLDNPEDAGRLRRSDDIIVATTTGGPEYHPPKADELEARLQSLCRFANQRRSDMFMHPIIRAVILHFLLAYDHPFVDGNGRTARALFYWSLLKDDYGIAQYIPISRRLKAAPAQYARAYLHTETDDNDITYFIVHQLDIMDKALEDTRVYLEKKEKEITAVDKAVQRLRLHGEVNHRQKALLGRAIRKPETVFTIESHRRSHGVAYQTARTDLLRLKAYGLLEKRRKGKAFVFVPAGDIGRKLKKTA